MTIYLDVSSAVHAKAGLSRYSQSLAEALRPLLGERLRLFQNSLGKKGPLWPDHAPAGARLGYRPWRAAVLAAQTVRWPMDELVPGAELFHATEHLLPFFRGAPTVLTVHDLVWERYPQYHKRANYLYLHTAMPLFCRRAQALIAISESTRRDLVELYGVPAERITVIAEAAAARFQPQPPERVAEVRARYGLPERYIVTVGTIEPRKNLGRLIEACGPLVERHLADALVLVGARGWLEADFFQQVGASAWRERILLPGYVADDDLPALYAGAAVTAQPSLYEGFGLPVLEAMASGSPVVCSQASSLPEVAGPAAEYFDPLAVESISAALERVLTDETLASELRQLGLARAAQFSWEATARQTLALYERTISAYAR